MPFLRRAALEQRLFLLINDLLNIMIELLEPAGVKGRDVTPAIGDGNKF
jgi:hypothetical protein